MILKINISKRYVFHDGFWDFSKEAVLGGAASCFLKNKNNSLSDP